MTRMKWTEMALRGGQLQRFHTWPTIGHETIAEHSFGVAMIVLALTDYRASANLLKAALYHDLAEQETGDIPANAKWDNPMFSTFLEVMEDSFNIKWKLDITLPPQDQIVLKWADMLQMLLFCKQQRDLGNRNMDTIFERVVEFLNKFKFLAEGQEMLAAILTSYDRSKANE